MYIKEIVSLLLWPVFMVITYFLVRWALKTFEEKHLTVDEQQEKKSVTESGN